MKKKNFDPIFSIIIPMFNEEVGAARCVDAIYDVLRTLEENVFLIIVNDGSKDKTLSVLLEKRRKYGKHLKIISYVNNKGYGGALQMGIQFAFQSGATFALFMDSDLTNDPKDIPKFIRAASPIIDCIKATRYSNGGSMKNVPVYRQVISRIGNIITSYCFGIGLTDCTNGFRLVRISLLKDLHFQEKNFAIILEELYELKKKQARFMEIPVILTGRVGTKTHFHYSLRTFFEYGKYAIKAAL